MLFNCRKLVRICCFLINQSFFVKHCLSGGLIFFINGLCQSVTSYVCPCNCMPVHLLQQPVHKFFFEEVLDFCIEFTSYGTYNVISVLYFKSYLSNPLPPFSSNDFGIGVNSYSEVLNIHRRSILYNHVDNLLLYILGFFKFSLQ